MQTWVRSLGWEDPLEKEMATHSSTLAWKIPWMEEPGRLQSMGSQKVRHNWATSLVHDVHPASATLATSPATLPTTVSPPVCICPAPLLSLSCLKSLRFLLHRNGCRLSGCISGLHLSACPLLREAVPYSSCLKSFSPLFLSPYITYNTHTCSFMFCSTGASAPWIPGAHCSRAWLTAGVGWVSAQGTRWLRARHSLGSCPLEWGV